jgi:hypothetical protein
MRELFLMSEVPLQPCRILNSELLDGCTQGMVSLLLLQGADVRVDGGVDGEGLVT